MVNKGWPALTGAPSWYSRFSMIPVTRARTSTSLDPSVCPTYSNATGKLRTAITCVVTSAGGNPAKPACCCDCPQAAKAAAIASAAAERRGENTRDIVDSCLEARIRFNATCGQGQEYIQSWMFVKRRNGSIVCKSSEPVVQIVRTTKGEAAITREQLLDAAERIFRDHGVAKTSLAEVATAAGVTRGAVYW